MPLAVRGTERMSPNEMKHSCDIFPHFSNHIRSQKGKKVAWFPLIEDTYPQQALLLNKWAVSWKNAYIVFLFRDCSTRGSVFCRGLSRSGT